MSTIPSSAPSELRTVAFDADNDVLRIIDQTLLPHELKIIALDSLEQACEAITAMRIRGAPLIGIVAAYAVYFALRHSRLPLQVIVDRLQATRPTAINLHWALQRVQEALPAGLDRVQQAEACRHRAGLLLQEDAAACSAIGDHGLVLLQQRWLERQQAGAEQLNVLTHCNAGWLATADWGTALSPVYKAHAAGIPVHVWVDETRPRNQGASLTVWELRQRGVPHTLIVDNAGGHLMQHGMVDLCLVGSDRTTAHGDVCNKIGTYLKALAAFDNAIPFYVALPVSTIDFSLGDGVRGIPIEERAAGEVLLMPGLDAVGQRAEVAISVPGTAVVNHGFDVTPARLVTALITELGVYAASEQGLAAIRAAADH